jgi:hypothetical protein
MATGKLIGADDASGSSGGANYFILDRFQALAAGKVTVFKNKSNSFGQIKLAIYADDNGEPGDLLVANNTPQSCISDWNDLSIPELEVTKDSYYWLAINTDTTGVRTHLTSGGARRYKSGQTFSTFTFPDPAGTGFDSNDYTGLVAVWGVLVVSPSGISQPLSYGSPKLNLSLKPSGIAQPLSAGTPAVVTSAAIIYPPGIAQAVGIGTPSLIYPQIISPPGIAQLVSVGIPSAGIVGVLSPQGISVIVSCGSPTLLKYVWHVVLDGRYNIESPEVNRSYIIGRDQYGNPVYGTAVDSTEAALVGERLDFQQELAIPTDSQAASMASAILSKMRLTGKRGVILIPPNCGQELFDVVQISDSGANQQAVSFRVVGIRFEYNPKQARFEHRLILGAV